MIADARDILLVGTGALATLFAARLAEAGFQVTLLGTWEQGLVALQQNGARLAMPDGSHRAYPVRIIRQICPDDAFLLAIVLVKSWQTRRAASQLAGCLEPDGLSVTLQNGLGNLEILAEVLGSQRAAGGITTLPATLLEPGLVRAGGVGTIHLGEHPHLAPLVKILEKAGIETHIHEDVRPLVWGKLAINAAINPLTALLEVQNGKLLDDPAARLMMRRAAREVESVASAWGIQLPFPDPSIAAEEVAVKTAHNISSMLQDLRRGAPTEIDAICGAVVQKGQEKGIRAPLNEAFYTMVKEKVESRHG